MGYSCDRFLVCGSAVFQGVGPHEGLDVHLQI